MAKKKPKKKKTSRKSNPGKKHPKKKTGKGRKKNPKGKGRRRGKGRRKNPASGMMAGLIGGALAEVVSTPAAYEVGKHVHSKKHPGLHRLARIGTRVIVGLGGAKIADKLGQPNLAAGITGGTGAHLAQEGLAHFAKPDHKTGLPNILMKMGYGHGSHIPLPDGSHIHVSDDGENPDGPHRVHHVDPEGRVSGLMGVEAMPFTMMDAAGNKMRCTALADLPHLGAMYQDPEGNLKLLEGVQLPVLGEVVRLGEVIKLNAAGMGEVVRLGDTPELPQLGDTDNDDEPSGSKHGYRRSR